ncbi:MAG: oligosaccharide flippase family protein [Moraxellaceae bacterium]|nr:oligosaccharide flippase family protein [Moraxellaceae bacterium]
MGILQKIKSHSVTKNVSALGVMQIANYVVPLLLLPFLARQLGIEAFGVVAITFASIQLVMVLTDYGFSLSATYAISVTE